MSGSCFCCVALKPRYKRLVDNIFPVNAQDGLVKNNMEKLTFYALSSPEKLDRIGEYLAQRMSRDVHRHRRIGFVFIAMEALDQLLVACHAQSINLFVESFLKMVQKLLEYENPDLQILATASFVKFANIEEDTPSYHRRYDFFVSRFSSMCHSDLDNETERLRIRTAGLHGIHGVVRKTVSDDLQVNIWEAVHMDKIVPSLLYNMHDCPQMSSEAESPKDNHPSVVAENTFRDLVCRASYGSIKSVLRPLLIHLDNHKLWVPNDFPIKCFKIIMYSVQAKYCYLVLQMLMAHLDSHTKSDPVIKANIVDVLFKTVLLSAGSSIGPSVLEVFDTLLRHLRVSVDTNYQDPEKFAMERKFQEALINTIGEFANNMPDYQKVDIMMFVLGKMPHSSYSDFEGPPVDTQLQMMLLRSLLKVAAKYKTVNYSNAFPPEFLNPLLKMSQVDDPGLRLIIQEILHTLLDRHGNMDKLKKVRIPADIAELELTMEKTARQDVMFMRKTGAFFYSHLYENMEMELNRVENLEALYCTMALICVELGSSEIFVDLCRLVLDIQYMACTNNQLPITHKCAVHSLLAAYMNLVCQLMALPDLCQYVKQVIETRKQEATYLLPDFGFNRGNQPNSYPQSENLKEAWLFSQVVISEHLRNSGHDTALLDTPITLKPFGCGENSSEIARSTSDIHSVNLEVESAEGSPHFLKRRMDNDVNFESMKKVLEDCAVDKEEEEKKRLEIVETFRSAPFEEIVAQSEAKSNHFHSKLTEILDLVSRPPDSPAAARKQNSPEGSISVFEMPFPQLYVY